MRSGPMGPFKGVPGQGFRVQSEDLGFILLFFRT